MKSYIKDSVYKEIVPADKVKRLVELLKERIMKTEAKKILKDENLMKLADFYRIKPAELGKQQREEKKKRAERIGLG
jgi:hypothetical protein